MVLAYDRIGSAWGATAVGIYYRPPVANGIVIGEGGGRGRSGSPPA